MSEIECVYERECCWNASSVYKLYDRVLFLECAENENVCHT